MTSYSSYVDMDNGSDEKHSFLIVEKEKENKNCDAM